MNHFMGLTQLLLLFWTGCLLVFSSYSLGASDLSHDHKEHPHFRHHKKQKIPILRNDNLEAMEVLHRGLQFLDKIQNPENCRGHRYTIRPIGLDAGFAAQFQLAASGWMRAFAETDFSIPVLLQGKLVGYSEGKECAAYNYSWNCYFLPTSRCEEELLKTGIFVPAPPKIVTNGASTPPDVYVSRRGQGFRSKVVTKTIEPVTNEDSIPPAFQSSGFFVWWGIIQAYLFRFQPHVEHYILSATHHMSNGRAFPYGLPMIGVHVRHGDKQHDRWKEFSLQEELQGIGGSPDCQLHSSYSINTTQAITNSVQRPTTTSVSIPICFTEINTASDGFLLWRVAHNQSVALQKADISKYANLFPNRTQEIFSLLRSVELPQHHRQHTTNESTLFDFYREYHLDPFAYYHIHEYNLTELIEKHRVQQQRFKTTDHLNDPYLSTIVSPASVSPLDIYIASDDPIVIAAARNLSYFVNKEGISQQTQRKQMIDIVMKNNEISHEASLQIISDIFLLSQCSTLVGSVGSQIFRMAVGLANAKGLLHHAKALDYHQLDKVRRMSAVHNIACPEEFSP